MRKLILLIAAMAALIYIVDWPSLIMALNGYEDYVTALALSAIISPLIAPMLD